MDLGSSIVGIFIGIALIILWLPAIYFTEVNNKNNNNEYDILREHIKKHLVVKDIKLNFDSPPSNVSNVIKNEQLAKHNNLYVKTMVETKTKLPNGQVQVIVNPFGQEFVVNIPFYEGKSIGETSYKYLSVQNLIYTDKIVEGNTTTTYYYYAIDKNQSIVKISGLQEYQEEIDMTIYNFEYGPSDTIGQRLGERKISSNVLAKWFGRGGTFLTLLMGLNLLVGPLDSIVQSSDSIGLSVLTFPIKIILALYHSVSFIGAAILTFLMTLLVWSLINKPYISMAVVALIVGMIMYFKNKTSQMY